MWRGPPAGTRPSAAEEVRPMELASGSSSGAEEGVAGGGSDDDGGGGVH